MGVKTPFYFTQYWKNFPAPGVLPGALPGRFQFFPFFQIFTGPKFSRFSRFYQLCQLRPGLPEFTNYISCGQAWEILEMDPAAAAAANFLHFFYKLGAATKIFQDSAQFLPILTEAGNTSKTNLLTKSKKYDIILL